MPGSPLEKGVAMQHPGTEDQMPQFLRDFLASLSLEERLVGMSPKELLRGLSPEDILEGLSPEDLERLRQLLQDRAKVDNALHPE
jgi:hypothetical protein